MFLNNCSLYYSCFDYLRIHDGPTNQSPVLGKYCGFSLPPNLLSSTHMIFIYFHSDTDTTENGLANITYLIVEK